MKNVIMYGMRIKVKAYGHKLFVIALKYEGEDSELIIGDRTVVREFCTLHRGTKDKGITKIGLIFNLDPHYKEGSHWVAMFIDNRVIGYFIWLNLVCFHLP